VVESRLNSSLEDSDSSLLLEIAEEEFRLKVLDFSVLDRSSMEKGVKLNGLVCCRSCFILTCGSSEPEMKVEAKSVLFLVGVQDDIRIVLIEGSWRGL